MPDRVLHQRLQHQRRHAGAADAGVHLPVQPQPVAEAHLLDRQVGAGQRQFLVEAAAVSVFGGVMGIVLGVTLAWTISEVGTTSEVQATPAKNHLGEPVADVQACVGRVLRGLAWPCTRSGQPEQVRVQLTLRR